MDCGVKSLNCGWVGGHFERDWQVSWFWDVLSSQGYFCSFGLVYCSLLAWIRRDGCSLPAIETVNFVLILNLHLWLSFKNIYLTFQFQSSSSSSPCYNCNSNEHPWLLHTHPTNRTIHTSTWTNPSTTQHESSQFSATSSSAASG